MASALPMNGTTRGKPRTKRPNTWAGRVGARIEAARRQRGLSVKQVARRLRISWGHIYRIERGESSAIVARHLERMAKILGTTAELLCGTQAGELPGPMRGLPEKLYGIPVIVTQRKKR